MAELIKCLVMSAYALWTVHGMYRTMIPKTTNN